MPIVPGLRSPYDTVGGLVYFGRLADKIRLHARGLLPEDYHGSLGKGQDRIVVDFLQVPYEELKSRILSHPQETDEALLEWAYVRGRRLLSIDLTVINGFLTKRGWRDKAAEHLPAWLARSNLPPDAAETNFDYIELDEGRSARRITL